MPVSYDLPIYQNPASAEDVNKYHKLPYWQAFMEAKMFSEWNLWEKLLPKMTWKPNNGTTARGVAFDPTAFGQSTFYPNVLTSRPKKDVIELAERSEDAVLHWHKYRSKLFNFLPSFQDFRSNQLEPVHKDMIRQMAFSNNLFIRTQLFARARQVYVIGAGLQAAPWLDSGTALTAANDPKGTDWRKAVANAITKAGISLADLDNICSVAEDEIGIPYFEGMANEPKKDSILAGKYLLLCDTDVRRQLKYDPHFANWRNVNISVTNDGFEGNIFDKLTTKVERFPLRWKKGDGTITAPQVTQFDQETNPLKVRTRPNPDYGNPTVSQIGVAFLVGMDVAKTITVGPPPSAFASRQISKDKFASLQWNGEIKLTDRVIIPEYDDSGTVVGYDSNVDGEYLQFRSTTTMGLLPNNIYNILPIVYQRQRPPIE